MSINRFYVISPLTLVALSACRSPYNSSVNGVISKGPLSNALVFLDLDGDNVLDPNEQSVRTDANGNFSISSTASAYKIVAITDDSTVDSSSGATLSGVMLTAPKGAAVVSPTSTLMAEGGLTADEVAKVLNLPDGVDPLEFNPFADNVDAADALAVEKISQQIMTAVSSFASAAEGAGASESGGFKAALTSVVDVVKVKAEKLNDTTATAAEKSLDFTKTADLDLIKAKVADEAQKVATAEGSSGFDKAALSALVNDTATSIENVNNQIKNVTDLKSDATKNVFSTLQVLNEQVKAAAETQKAGGTGSIAFKDAAKVSSAASNFAPQDIKISNDKILEGTKDLVLGSLSTIDKDQGSGVAFKYEIAKAEGTDHKLFEINSKGELVLLQSPDYSEKSSYEVFIVTTDDGGKKFSKKIKIDVTPDPHENFLVKFKVKYVEEGDVGKEYNTNLAASKAGYETFLGRIFDNTNDLGKAIDSVFSGGSHGSSSGSGGSGSGSGGTPNYAQMFGLLPSNARPTVAETSQGFSVTYPVASADDWKMTVIVKGYTADSGNAYGAKDGASKSIDFFDPMTWTVAGGLESVEIFKGSNKALSVSMTNTTMQIKGEAGFASNFNNGDVGALSLQGDFTKINGEDFFAILDQLSVNPSSSSSSSSSGDPFSSSHSHSSSSSGSSSSSAGSNNYTINKILVFGKDSSTDGLTDNPIAQSEIAKGSLSLKLGDFTMSLVSQQLPDYITAGDLFNFASVDLLDVEEIVKDGVDGLFTLNHATHGDIVIIESDMSSAKGKAVTIGTNDTFGTYEGDRFVSDSNDIVAAYFDFGNTAVTDAQFEAYWNSINGITDMFTEIV